MKENLEAEELLSLMAPDQVWDKTELLVELVQKRLGHSYLNTSSFDLCTKLDPVLRTLIWHLVNAGVLEITPGLRIKRKKA